MNKKQKTTLVSEIKDNLVASSFVAVVHYRGMNDKQLYAMRLALRNKECSMKIAKNTLLRVALKGTELENLSPYLKGPTAVLYSNDPVALSKVIADTAKEIQFLKPQIAYLNNSLISENEIQSMAKLGSLQDVRASFVYTLKSVQSNMASLIKNYASSLEEKANL